MASPSGRGGHQAARVDREEGDVVADGGVDGAAQLRFVVHAGLADAAGEIDQGLLFGQRAQHAGGRFQRGQFAVGIEDVEFGIVGGEGGAGIFLVIGAGGAVHGEIGAFADGQALDDLGERVAIVGEILQDLEVAGERHDGHQVGGRHLGLEELLGGGLGADLVLNRHGGHVEEHDQQAAVLVLHFAGLGGRDLIGGDGFHGGRGGSCRRVRRLRRGAALWRAPVRGAARGLFQFLEVKILMSCFLPSSVMLKSAGFSPLMGFPLLSFTVTSTTTNWVVAPNLTTPLERAGGGGWQPVASAEAAPKLPAARSKVWR